MHIKPTAMNSSCGSDCCPNGAA
uniref:Uncharacterized protein n=1 Tax=Anguilla anguilla TaxID=7936 RepID=A0A0E9UZV0_ANGAN